MTIITIGNTKGGVGKSTLAANLATEGLRRRKSVLLIDADIQGSSMSFRDLRATDDLTAMAITKPTIHKDLPKLTGYDLIIIDAGGRDSTVFRSAVMAADFLLVPVLPSVYDVWAAVDTLDLLKEARVYREDLHARIVLNQVRDGRVMGREALEALKQYEDDAPTLRSVIHYGEIFKKTPGKGQGVVEAAPGSKTANEIVTLYDEIKSIVGGM